MTTRSPLKAVPRSSRSPFPEPPTAEDLRREAEDLRREAAEILAQDGGHETFNLRDALYDAILRAQRKLKRDVGMPDIMATEGDHQGRNPSTLRAAIADLVALGRLIRIRRGRYVARPE